MSKKVSFLVLLLVLAGLSWATYPKVGGLMYQSAMTLESALYGLDKSTVDTGDISLSVYQGGPADAPVIMMLHGYSSDKDVWLRFASHLVDDYRILIVDMAGHGETGFKPEWDYSIAAQSQRLNDLLNTLKLDAVHVIGNSMGGWIAADFSLRFPERIRSTALVDPAGVNSPVPSDMEKMLAEGRNPFEQSSREEFYEFYSMTMAKPPWLPRPVLDHMAEEYMASRQQLARIFEDFHNDPRMESRLSEFQKPVLLLWGREDQLLHVRSVETWQAGIEDLQVTVWDDVGHMPMIEIPEQSAARYRTFLASAQR